MNGIVYFECQKVQDFLTNFQDELKQLHEIIKDGESEQPLDIRSPEFLRQT